MNKLVTFAFAIAVLGVPATTRADDTDQVAKQSFERGRQLAGEAKWTQAFDAFSAGYDASHRSVFLFNMAECARALDDAPRARGLYQQYLTASPTGDLADTARARLAAMPGAVATTTTAPPVPTTTTPPRPATTTTPPPAPTVSTTRPTTTTTTTVAPPPRPTITTTPPAPTTVATRPVSAPPHATTLSTPPAPTITATTATTATTTTLPPVAKPAPSLTVAQLPPTSPAERPINGGLIVDSHPSEPIYRRTSFWVGVGVAVAATTVAIIAASSTHDNSCSSPGCIDLRK